MLQESRRGNKSQASRWNQQILLEVETTELGHKWQEIFGYMKVKKVGTGDGIYNGKLVAP